MLRSLIIAALTVAPLAAWPLHQSAAQTTAALSDHEELYARYHAAIEVAGLCRDISFDQADIERMAAVIHSRIEHDIGAKRLTLLRQGQAAGEDVVDDEGCDSDEARDLLALYDRDLAPVVD